MSELALQGISLVGLCLVIILYKELFILAYLLFKCPKHLDGKNILITFEKKINRNGELLDIWWKPHFRECSPSPKMVYNKKKNRIEIRPPKRIVLFG